MNNSAATVSRELRKTSLYSPFLDSSSDDTSSTGSISESTSTEVNRLMDNIRKEYSAPMMNSSSNIISVGFQTATLRPPPRESENSSSTEESCFHGLHPISKASQVMREKIDLNKNNQFCPQLNIASGHRPFTGKLEDQKNSPAYSIAKLIILVIIWVLCTIVLIEKKEKVISLHQISIPANETKSYWIKEYPERDLVSVVLEGAFLPHYYANLSSWIANVWIEFVQQDGENHRIIQNISRVWSIPVVSEELQDVVPNLMQREVIKLDPFNCGNLMNCSFRLRFRTNLESSFPVALNYDSSPIDMENGVIYAAGVLLILYICIIFEIIHRTLAGMLAATISVAALAALNERPTIAELASWIDFETLLLLFSMMILVAVFSETGVFDYLSVCTYQVTNGRIWPLIITLCLLSALMSSLVDNVTTALLMTPVTIRSCGHNNGSWSKLSLDGKGVDSGAPLETFLLPLDNQQAMGNEGSNSSSAPNFNSMKDESERLCEVMELNPILVLMAIMIFSNIGGALTPVGDPPNVIVASHPDVKRAGINFGVFFLHMSIGLTFVSIAVFIQLKIMFSRIKVLRSDDPLDMQDLKHEIAIWQRAAASLSSYSKDEDVVKETLLKRVRRLLSELKTRITMGRGPSQGNYSKTLEELKQKYPIRNKPLLFKSGFALTFVIVVFFLHSIPNLHLSLGCTAFMGALLLLLISDQPHLEGVLARVEWSTLLFFASLFILMEAVTRLRLIEWIGRRTESLILDVGPEYRLPVSILLILWISAGVSAFVDNIPLTSMMIRIVVSMSQNPELNLPLMPHVWALSYGACLGGVATLIGSSCNVVCAGIAEQHGYRFSFVQYSKIGIPVALVSLVIVTIYLLIAHVVIGWND